MICRRCGLESSTTDLCEWCKKPMLPEGGTVSVKAKNELLREQAKGVERAERAQTEPPKPASDGEMAPARPGLTPPPPPPEAHKSELLALGAHLSADNEPKEESPSLSAAPADLDKAPLRPLSHHTSNQSDGASDLSAETTRYIGSEENILQPIERPQGQGSSEWKSDPTTGRRKRVVPQGEVIPDKVRIKRAAPRGVIVGFLLAFIELLIFHKVPENIAMVSLPGLRVSHDPGFIFVNVLAYGFYCALLFGFMLPALLVNRKWGAEGGLFIGLILGYSTLGNGQALPIVLCSVLAGAIAGVLVGKITGKGVKRVVNL